MDSAGRSHHRDELTGLLDHDAFAHLVEKLLSEPHGCTAIAFIELDRMEIVTDLYGQRLSDLVLVETAERITAEIRSTDAVARLGGHTFAAVISPVDEPAEIERLADRLLEAIAQPMEVVVDGADDEVISMTASIGLAVGQDGSARDLLTAADNGLFDARRRRGNTWGMWPGHKGAPGVDKDSAGRSHPDGLTG